jgi:double-strand break repair protein MRE11
VRARAASAHVCELSGGGRHAALLQIQGKEFQLQPLPLRTVRPFVLDELALLEAAADEGFEASDQHAVTKFLRARVRARAAAGRGARG